MFWLMSFLGFTKEFTNQSHLVKAFSTVMNAFPALEIHIHAKIICLLYSITILDTLYLRLESKLLQQHIC